MRAPVKTLFFVLLIILTAACTSTGHNFDSKANINTTNASGTNASSTSVGTTNPGSAGGSSTSASKSNDSSYFDSIASDIKSNDNGFSDPQLEYGGQFRVRTQSTHGINQ
jgi:hypothetical protein